MVWGPQGGLPKWKTDPKKAILPVCYEEHRPFALSFNPVPHAVSFQLPPIKFRRSNGILAVVFG